VAGKAREEIEARTGRKVISKENHLIKSESKKKLERK
jgi:hypothetical protein